MYQNKNHLGNVHLSYADLDGDGEINPATEILEEKNYYPFGLQHDGYNMGVKDERSIEAEQYTFLDKQFEDSFGLNVTETDFRHYDSTLGRFNVMDPLAELAYDFTPYRYGFNNPVFWSDASGLFETEDDAKGYMKANKLSGARVEFDADTNLWKIIDGNVTITKIGNMINKMYVIGDQIHLSQTRDGGGGGSSKQNTKIESQMSRNYTNSGFRHFVNWEGWKFLVNLIQNGAALSTEGGSNTKAPNGGRNVTYIDVEWLTVILDALKLGPDSKIPGAVGNHTPNTFDKKNNESNSTVKTETNNNPQELVKFTKKIFMPEERSMKKTGAAVTRVTYDTMIEPTMINHHNNLNRLDSIKNTK